MNFYTRTIVLMLVVIYAFVTIYIAINVIYKAVERNPKEADAVPKKAKNKFKIVWCQPQRFVKEPTATNRPRVALVSYPGSGTSWLRYLLQQATGIFTGSFYKDNELIESGFFGESVSSKNVSLVTTHEWGHDVQEQFDKAILLIRAATPAIESNFNTQKTGRFKHATVDQYLNNDEWAKFVQNQSLKWRNLNLDWLINYNKPLLIVSYHDLITDALGTMQHVINFVELPVSSSNLNCMSRRERSIFKRPAPSMNFTPYTRVLKETVIAHERLIYLMLEKTIKMDIVSNHNSNSVFYKSTEIGNMLHKEDFIWKKYHH